MYIQISNIYIQIYYPNRNWDILLRDKLLFKAMMDIYNFTF